MATKVAPRRPAMGMATVGAIATLSTANKPRPPSSPRSSCADITNGMGGAEGKEVARLSAKILDLMSQLQARDAQRHHLEAALELARRMLHTDPTRRPTAAVVSAELTRVHS